MRLPLLLVALAACDPIDFDFPEIRFGGPILGDKGVAMFTFADGCPARGADIIWGCPLDPALAVGSRARFIVSALDADADAHRLAHAHANSTKPYATASIDPDGLLVVESSEPGMAHIQLIDDGDVVDEFSIPVGSISTLEVPTDDSDVVLAGPRIGLRVNAFDGHLLLFAGGAVDVSAEGALAIVDNRGDETEASVQVPAVGLVPGPATVTFTAGDQVLTVPYRVVTRADITRVEILGSRNARDKTKTSFMARAYVGDSEVRGGPACDWRIVQGRGTLTTSVGDDTRPSLLGIYDTATLNGTDNVVLECRANPTVTVETDVFLAPSGQGPSRALLEHQSGPSGAR